MTDPNLDRLRAVMALFRVRQTEVCRATGYSKAYISRLLNEDGFHAGTEFWVRLNNRLLGIINEGASHVFQVEAVPGIADAGISGPTRTASTDLVALSCPTLVTPDPSRDSIRRPEPCILSES